MQVLETGLIVVQDYQKLFQIMPGIIFTLVFYTYLSLRSHYSHHFSHSVLRNAQAIEDVSGLGQSQKYQKRKLISKTEYWYLLATLMRATANRVHTLSGCHDHLPQGACCIPIRPIKLTMLFRTQEK